MSYKITTYLVDRKEIENIWNSKDKTIFKLVASTIEDEDTIYLQNIIDGSVTENDAWKLKLLYQSLCDYFGESNEEEYLSEVIVYSFDIKSFIYLYSLLDGSISLLVDKIITCLEAFG